MPPSARTMRRNASAISARRAMMLASGSGIRMGPLPVARGEAAFTYVTDRRRWSGRRRRTGGRGAAARGVGSALTRLVARVDLVDHVDPPLAPDDTTVLVALLQRFQRI